MSRYEEIRESVEDALWTEGTSYRGNLASVIWDASQDQQKALNRVADGLFAIAEAIRESKEKS